jgi:DNA primase
LREEKEVMDLISLGHHFEEGGDDLIKQLLAKKVNTTKAEEGLVEVTQKILERNWMQKREVIKTKIQGGKCEESEALLLAREFDLLKQARPKVKR